MTERYYTVQPSKRYPGKYDVVEKNDAAGYPREMTVKFGVSKIVAGFESDRLNELEEARGKVTTG